MMRIDSRASQPLIQARRVLKRPIAPERVPLRLVDLPLALRAPVKELSHPRMVVVDLEKELIDEARRAILKQRLDNVVANRR